VNKTPIALLLVAGLLAGCATTNEIGFDETMRASKQSLAIYNIDQMPSKQHKEISALSFRGLRADQSKAFRYFVKEARRLGADGIIMYGPGEDYLKGRGLFGPGGGLIGFGPDFVFRASAIVYDP
jgi:predicted small secreted protein